MMENISLLMFPVMILVVFSGFPVVFCLMGISLFFGIVGFGPEILPMLIRRVYSMADNYVLAAVPLFIFMGTMLERSGIAKILFETISLWTGRIKNGLAVTTILMCTIIAACTGIIGAAEVMVGVMAMPPMLMRKYNHSLIAGTIIAGGALGTIIPPSVVTVVYGPAAGISVGRLLISTIFPGLLISSIFIIYILIRSYAQRGFAPPVWEEDMGIPLSRKLKATVTGMLPSVALIFTVMGTIILGYAAPTEAAALGAFGSVLLTIGYGNFSMKVLKEAMIQTLKISSMMMLILTAGAMFSGVFLGLGGSDATDRLLSAMNMAPWAVVAFFLLVAFLAGFLLDWGSILLIFVPIFSPIIDKLGFDPIWFGTLFIMMIQTSYLTPPMAPGIFYLRGIAPPELTTHEIFRG
ncbi:MAG: TRAP transporter large permease subunit, partial [Deltaproteobacteria bacterium]|nr:TRAP transporter large permease subunit [Deltaproteobacteria bacterium]